MIVVKKDPEKKKISRTAAPSTMAGENFMGDTLKNINKIMHPQLTRNINVVFNTNPRELFGFRVKF